MSIPHEASNVAVGDQHEKGRYPLQTVGPDDIPIAHEIGPGMCMPLREGLHATSRPAILQRHREERHREELDAASILCMQAREDGGNAFAVRTIGGHEFQKKGFSPEELREAAGSPVQVGEGKGGRLAQGPVGRVDRGRDPGIPEHGTSSIGAYCQATEERQEEPESRRRQPGPSPRQLGRKLLRQAPCRSASRCTQSRTSPAPPLPRRSCVEAR